MRNGEAEEKLPALLPVVPDIPLGDGESDVDSEEPGHPVEEGTAAAANKESFAREGTRDAAKDEDSVDVSDFVISMSDSAETGNDPGRARRGDNRGARPKARRAGKEGPRRPRQADGGYGSEDLSSMNGGYQEQVQRELERMGGVDKVPPLSSLVQQLESQDGNTL